MGRCGVEATGSLLTDSDIRFLVQTVLPGRADSEQVVALVRDDPEFVEALLGHERVFERLAGDEEMVLKVSPYLYFSVLLRRVRQDLRVESYTYERRQHQRVAIFDAGQAAELLAGRPVRDYLAGMLASFTRMHGFTRRVRVRKGIWRRQRVNDLDIDSLVRYAGGLDEEQRFEVYKRIADVCLFMTGMFPEHIESRSRYLLGVLRPQGRRSIEDYEREGRAFYGLAAGHRGARAGHLSAALSTLAENFTLAEKPLFLLSDHYLRLRKHTLFEL